MKLQDRSKTASCNQWDLSHIYKTREDWEKALTEATRATEALLPLATTLGTSANALAAGLAQILQAQQLQQRVYIYAYLTLCQDNGDADAQQMEERARALGVLFESTTAFVEPELLAINAQTLQQYLMQPELIPYRHRIENIVRGRAHVLPFKEEKMLAMLQDAAGSCRKGFEMLQSVDMPFPAVHDEQGRLISLSHGNYGVLRESRSRAVRKEAFAAYFGTYRQYCNTFAALLGGSIKMDCYYSRQRNFSDACEMALFQKNVPSAVYDTLIAAVHAALPLLHDYLALRKQILGLDTLHMYDLYCPMVPQVEMPMPFEKAKALVLQATACLGEAYTATLERAFEERWIDIYENRGKTTGAFSCGVWGVHPYVLLNYTETLDDAFTLAHELGHCMHSYLADQAQSYGNHAYEILVAEVASTVNEVLLTKYLLAEEQDPARRAYIANHLLEDFRTTVFRQTLFAEFERTTHRMYQAGEPLTASAMNALYHSLNEQYYQGVEIDAEQDVEWAHIPHFYDAFYVFQYATGFCTAVAIAGKIFATQDATAYFAFLRSGGSMYPMEQLASVGIDLTNPKTVQDAMELFADTLQQLREMLL